VVKIDCHLFKIEIPNVLAEFITTMNGCLCQYICKKKKHSKSDCFGSRMGNRTARNYLFTAMRSAYEKRDETIEIFLSMIARATREKNTVFYLLDIF